MPVDKAEFVPDLSAVLPEPVQDALAVALAEILRHGYGRLTLVVEGGCVKFMETAYSERVPAYHL